MTRMYPMLWYVMLLAFAKACFCSAELKTEIANSHYRIVLHGTSPGLIRLENRHVGQNAVLLSSPTPQPLFALTINKPGLVPGTQPQSRAITSRDFRTLSIKKDHTTQGNLLAWGMKWASGDLRVEVHIDIRSDATPESVWAVTLQSNQDLDATFAFPILDGLRLGRQPGKAWYFHPRWCGLLNDTPVDVASVYGQYVRMQVMAACSDPGVEASGPTGVYLVTRDRSMMRKTYELVKRIRGTEGLKLRDEYGLPFWSGFKAKEGIGMAVSWLRVALKADRRQPLPPVVLGIGAVDWRDAIASYSKWMRTWCPVHGRSARNCFQHVSFDLFSQPNCDTALAELDRHPYPDYLQFMVQKNHVNGEYGYREDWGLPELQRFVRECQRRGIVTNHYVEGYVVSKGSSIWKERGQEWGQMSGKEFQIAFANQCMWLGSPEWHRWLRGETTRLVRDLGLDSLYLDEVGFGTLDKTASDNPRHLPGRLQPDGAMAGVRDLMRTVREGLDQVNPRTSMYTEGPAVDCLFPYLDGVEDYSCRQWNSLPQPYRIPVHFLRFVFPDFKFADIPEGTQQEIDQQVRMCLFNGIGTFTSLASRDPADWLERMHVVERESRDAFDDAQPTPLVNTLQEGIFCNRFIGPDKTLFTLFNTNDYLVSGQVLRLPDTGSQRHWVDLLHLSNLRVEKRELNDRAILGLGPGEVAVIAALPVRLQVRREGERFWITAPEPTANERIALALVDRDNLTQKQRPLEPVPEGFSLSEVSEAGKYRAVLKLYRGDLVHDVLPVPELSSLDLAEAADATGSLQAANRDPRTVNGLKSGIYEFNWDDKERWVQLSWRVPQTFNTSELRCSQTEYSPQKYTYLTSQDGKEWRVLEDLDREGKPKFDMEDVFPRLTTRFLRLQIKRGGPWGDHTAIVRWRIHCKPEVEKLR